MADYMIGLTFGTVSETLNILFILLITSFIFNAWIDQAGNRAEGQDWKLVVVGVFYTQLAIGLLDTILNVNAFWLGMLAYTVSGFPMAWGAHRRHQDMLKRANKALKE